MKTTLTVSRISRNDLMRLLSNVETSMFVSMVTNCPVDMNKYLDYWIVDENGKKRKNPNPTINPFFNDGIVNHSEKYQIITGFDYPNSVNGRRIREGKEPDFVSGQGREPWFDVISRGLVTDKKTHTKFYFRYQYLDTSTLSTEYRHNGNLIEKHLFESFMTEKSSYDNQGLEDPLQFQVCDLRNIEEISIMGNHYILFDE